jgi:branched-chain amino acid transport system substrate-binding protein
MNVGGRSIKPRRARLDQEKLIDAMKGPHLMTPFGMIEYRPIDHQSTLGAYVGKIGVKDGKGVMKSTGAIVDGQGPALPMQRCRRSPRR